MNSNATGDAMASLPSPNELLTEFWISEPTDADILSWPLSEDYESLRYYQGKARCWELAGAGLKEDDIAQAIENEFGSVTNYDRVHIFSATKSIAPKDNKLLAGHGRINLDCFTPEEVSKYIVTGDDGEIEEDIIFIGKVSVLAKKNISLICGPKKSRKTSVAVSLARESKLKTLYVDTEQPKSRLNALNKSIPDAKFISLKTAHRADMMKIVNTFIMDGTFLLLVIDNIRDFIENFNDITDAARVERWLLQISEKIPVLVTQHTNRSSKSAQGHLGAAMEKISYTVIQVELISESAPDKGSKVTCGSSRYEPFPPHFLTKDGELIARSGTISKPGSTNLDEKEPPDEIKIRQAFGTDEYEAAMAYQKIGEALGKAPGTIKNQFKKLSEQLPGLFNTRDEGKRTFIRIAKINV